MPAQRTASAATTWASHRTGHIGYRSCPGVCRSDAGSGVDVQWVPDFGMLTLNASDERSSLTTTFTLVARNASGSPATDRSCSCSARDGGASSPAPPEPALRPALELGAGGQGPTRNTPRIARIAPFGDLVTHNPVPPADVAYRRRAVNGQPK